MDAWRPPQKRAVDLIENALCILALLSIFYVNHSYRPNVYRTRDAYATGAVYGYVRLLVITSVFCARRTIARMVASLHSYLSARTLDGTPLR